MKLRTALAIALVAVSLGACDEAQVRDSSTSQPLVFNEAGLRVLVTPDGLAKLYERAREQGFPVTANRREVWREEGIVIEAGPLSQPIETADFVANSATNAVEWETRFEDVEIIVPLRVTRGADVRICRKALTSDSATVTATVELVDVNGSPTFEVTTAPVLQDDGWSVRDVGACSQGDLPVAFDLEGALTTFVRDAFITSTVDALETSPLETLGVVLGRLEVRRVSAFESNRGTIVIEGRLPEDGAAVSAMGLSAEVNTALDVTRAGCAPPVELPAVSGAGAALIDPSEVADADVALAVSQGLLTRVVQVIALSGFSCRGSEDLRDGTANLDAIPTDELLLEEIGLGDLPLGESSRVVYRPGTLPSITLRQERGDLLLEWNELTVEVYSELFGVPTRLASLSIGAEATLRPGAGAAGSVEFSVDTINVNDVVIDSDLAADVEEATLRAWTRRTLLVSLSDLFTFPLPLAPGNGIEVSQTQIRSGDLVVFGSL